MKYIFMSQPLITGIERFPRGIGFSAVRLARRCSKPTKRRLLGVDFLFLFCAAALPLQAASWYFDSGGDNAAWSTLAGSGQAHWSASSGGGSDVVWANGNLAYFYSSAVTPANPMNVTIGSAGVSTPQISGNSYCTTDLIFNSSTITLTADNISGATAYGLIRITTAHTMTFNSVLAGSTGAYFGYDTAAGGRFVLGANNTYTGGTIIGAGTLVIQNGVNATGTGGVVVENDPHGYSSAGTLTWNTSSAAIGGSVTVGGASGLIAKLGPAGGIASLNIGGGITFNAYSEPIFTLSSTYNGVNDKVVVHNGVNGGGVQVGISCGGTLDTSSDYVLFTSGGVTGNFNSTPIWTSSTPTYAGQYTIITSGSEVHLHFTPIAITVTAAANTKTYDGTTSAAATPTHTGTLASGDSFSPTETYAARNAGTGLTLTPAGTVSGGNGYYTYTYNTVSTGVINQKALTVSGITAPSTVYDGTTTAKLGGTAAFATAETAGTGTTSDGIPYSVDSVSAGGTAAGTLAARAVGSEAVTITGVTVTGTGNGNYSATQQTGLSQTVTAKALTVSGITAPSTVYDGTTTAKLGGTAAFATAETAGTGTTSDGIPYSVDAVSPGTVTGTLAAKDVGSQAVTTAV